MQTWRYKNEHLVFFRVLSPYNARSTVVLVASPDNRAFTVLCSYFNIMYRIGIIA